MIKKTIAFFLLLSSFSFGQDYDIEKIIQNKKTILTYNFTAYTLPTTQYSRSLIYNSFDIERGFSKNLKINISHTIFSDYTNSLMGNTYTNEKETFSKNTNLEITYKIKKNIIYSVQTPITKTTQYYENSVKKKENASFDSFYTSFLLYKTSPPLAFMTKVSYLYHFKTKNKIKNGNEIQISPTLSFSINQDFSLIIGAVLSNLKPSKTNNKIVSVEQNNIYLLLGGQLDLTDKIHCQLYFNKGDVNALSFSTSYEI